MSNFAVARPGQAESQDVLRWGDVKSLANLLGATLPSAVQQSNIGGKQLVNAHWKWPLTWQTLFVLVPQFAPDETGQLDVDFNITVGCGGGVITFQRRLHIPASAISVYSTVIDDALILPAQDIQIDLALVSTPDNNSFTGPGQLIVGAFVAPVTEAHAMTHMLACMCEGQEQRQGGWMPPGFNPTPLGYTR